MSDPFDSLQSQSTNPFDALQNPSYKDPSAPKPESHGILSRFAESYGKGSGQLVQGLGWLINSDTLQDIGKDTSKYWAEEQARDPETFKQLEKVTNAQGFWDTAKETVKNPRAFVDFLASSLPSQAVGMGVGGVTAKVAGSLAYKAALTAGASESGALEAATLATARASANKAAVNAGSLGNVTAEGVTQAGFSGSEVEDYLLKNGYTPEQAKAEANKVAIKTGLSTAALAGLTSKMETRATMGLGNERGIKPLLKTTGLGAAEEAGQNVSQEYFEGGAKREANPTYESDYGKSLALGALTGGLMSGGTQLIGNFGAKPQEAVQLPTIGDQINEERNTQIQKNTVELQNAQSVDQAIDAATKINNVPVYVKTSEDIALEPLTTPQKVEQIKSLVGTPEMQEFISSLPEDERTQVMDVMNMALSPTAPTRTQSAEELHQYLSDKKLFEPRQEIAPAPIQEQIAEPTKNIIQLRDEVKSIVSSKEWQDHVASLPDAERVETNQIVANALNPLLPASYRTKLAETVLEYSAQTLPNLTSKIQVKENNSLEPVVAPIVVPNKIRSNDPKEIIANSQFEQAIGNLSYVPVELLPTSGEGLTRQAAESIQKLGQALGAKVHFFNQKDAEVRLDGYAHPDHKQDIFVNVGRGDAGWHYVAGHEFFHQLPTELKRTFIENITPLIPAEKLGKLKEYINQGTLDEGGQWEEIGADLFGNRFGEADFLSKLLGGVKDTPTLLKMVKAIREFVDSVLNSLKTQGFATDKFVSDLQKVRDAAQSILEQHLSQVKEQTQNVSESSKVEQETTQAQTQEDEAKTILDQAGVVGKERLDAIKDYKAGTVSIEELKSAYPPSNQFLRAEKERIRAEKEKAFAEQEALAQPKPEEIKAIIESGRDAQVEEAEALTQLQGFDESVPTAIEQKMNDAVNSILRIPVSKRSSLQKKMLKKFGVDENKKPVARLVKKKPGVEGLRDSLKAKNPFLAFLAENGINTSDRSDVGGQDNKRYFAAGYGAIFRKKGLRLDELAQLAEEQGFLTAADVSNESDNGGVNRLAEMINAAINGKVVTTGEQDFDFQSYYDDQLKNTALEFGIDIRGKSLDRLAELVNMHYAAMDEATIAAREAEFELQLQEISDELLEQLQSRSIENLLDENETDNQRPDENDVEPTTSVTPKVDKQRNLKEKNFYRKEIERILDIPEERRSKKDRDFLARNENKLSSERKAIEPSQELESIFAGLDKSGLPRARAQSKLESMPNAKEIQYVHDNFLDILEQLEDSGVLSINCD